jgi:hypothetical protein
MAFEFPNPRDATINEPCVVVSPKNVIKLYRLILQGESEMTLTRNPTELPPEPTIYKWAKSYAKDLGWEVAEQRGGQLVLIASLSLNV